MRIVFCGEDGFSSIALESLIRANHEILAVFCPKYEHHRHARLEQVCANYNVSFYRVDDINAVENENSIKSLRPDLISVCHFEKILKKNIIRIPAIGCINLHPSLLPKYKGLAPQHWPIINGDAETGISVHFIDEGIDTGPVILQHRIALDSNTYVSDLQYKMSKIYAFIVREAIDLIKDGKFTPNVQQLQAGSYYGKLKEEQCVIDMEKGHLKAHSLIRGVSRPYFGARLGNYRIWKASIATNEQNRWIQDHYDNDQIYVDDKLGPLIKFKDGSLLIEKYSIINSDKKESYEEQNCKSPV